MRLRFLSAALCLGILLPAAAAHAGFLASASWVTEFRPFGTSAVGIAVPLTASGTSTSSSVSVSLVISPLSTSFPITGSVDATLSLSGAQLVTATAGMGGATEAVSGAIRTRVPATTILRVPLAVGVKGTTAFTGYYALNVVHYITVGHYAWTPGPLTFTGLTSKLVALPNVVTAGSFMLDANGAGTVTLVAPTRIQVQSSYSYKTDVAISRLTLTFVPEPDVLLLLAAAGLVFAAARR